MEHAPLAITPLDAWKDAVRKGTADDSAVLRKIVKAGPVKALEGRKLAFIISSAAVDRDEDTINPKGWDWSDWQNAGAPVMWAHNYSVPPYNVPIASGDGTPTLVEGSKLRSVADFGDVAGIYPFADMIYELARPRENGKALRRFAASVGFRPVKDAYKWNEKRGGIDFEKTEGLEWSFVPIGSNRDSYQEAKSLGVDLAPMKDWAEQTLDAVSGEPGFWLPKSEAVDAFKALSSPKVAGFDPEPFLSAFAKRGRTLSAANESRIRSAADAAGAVAAALDEVLAQLPEEPADPKTAGPGSSPVLRIRPEMKFVVRPESLKAAVSAAVTEVVSEQIRKARGRLD